MTEYAVYKGDELLVIGTREECAAFLDVKPETIRHYASPAGQKRSAARKNPEKCLFVERI